MLDSDYQLQRKQAPYYLGNLIFFIIPLFIFDMSWQAIGMSLLALIVFLYCYFCCYRIEHKRVWQPIIGILITAIAITPYNQGSLSLFIFAGFFIAFFYPMKQAFWGLISIVISLFVLNKLLNFPHFYFAIYGSALVLGISIIGVVERQRQQNQRLRQQSETEIKQLATMLERERIGRDLHDLMGHSLSSITLKAELAHKLLANNNLDAAMQQLQELTEISRASMSQIRHAVSDFKAPNLSKTLNQLCDRLRDKNIAVSLTGSAPQLEADIEHQLSLCLTELINNILRHSKASVCNINIQSQTHQLVISVTDNGQATQIKEGNGIKGIRERLTTIDGRLSIELQQVSFIIEVKLNGVTT